ncbi:MAG: HlyD family type I secretion periplasmic adaptor subunit [Gammaproteobacteria bacterium]|nr:HlyD family type I secretion periplasmic adaptor subunit [Gammaproteobacteria bacterium]MBU0849733.1 HlyD family type I secretion periplasmic adaptor subunit [Gammaproteobacteria bacterium]MBU1266184.1 HlyD family type I secretion periplasmic adaptor subunit [Gammaproteobacteria bacterium]MBU1529375.1 HlyD family type I secretion periplasmic adaptor subunit [Gammaproteobacteria bacterium]MBU1779246.1 HlyD family type I secretion periplasmic adaptor subunit [Gammaproteobacteria bacterium]
MNIRSAVKQVADWTMGRTGENQMPEEATLDQSRLWAEQQILTKRLVHCCAITLLGLLAWSAIATVPQAAHGEARVVPSQRLQVIQAVDGGVINQVFVREGELVKAGDKLVQIDITRFSSSLKEKEALDASFQFREARLLAQLNNTQLSLPEALIKQFPDLFLQESKLLQSKSQEWTAQTQIYEQQLDQRQRELDEAQSNAAAAKRSLESSEQELASMRPLLKSGAVSPIEILRLEREASKARGDFEAGSAQSNRLYSAIREARQKIEEIRLKQINEARTELSEVKARLASLEQNQIELSDRVNQATLKTPVDGLVQRILYNTRGAVVPAGKEVIEIVPIDEQLVFETRINPKDVAFIQPSQRASIRVTAYDYSIYGALEGKVESISADSLIDEFGRPYFSVKVTVPRLEVNEKVRLMPGMVANVSIETDERTVLSYLTKPVLRGSIEAFTEQ